MQTEKTPVIFRQDNHSGQIIAVFPTILGNAGPDSFIGFTSAEKKITITENMLRDTKTVPLEASIGVLQDAVANGFYPLHVCQRIKGYMHKARLTEVKSNSNVKSVTTSKSHKAPRPNRWLQEAA